MDGTLALLLQDMNQVEGLTQQVLCHIPSIIVRRARVGWAGYRIVRAQNADYATYSVAVPVNVVAEAIKEASLVILD